MKNYWIPLYPVAAVAFVWGFIVISQSNIDRQWAVPLGMGFFLIGATASMTATAIKKISEELFRSKSDRSPECKTNAEKAGASDGDPPPN
jgi:hypothetical protein